MTQEEREKKRQETLRKMRMYKLHASEVDILEEAGELWQQLRNLYYYHLQPWWW